LAPDASTALEGFRTSLRLDPYSHQTRVMVCITLVFMGRLTEAELELARAQGLYPEDPVFRGVHAVVYALRGQKDAAREALAGTPYGDGRDPEKKAMGDDLIEIMALFGDVDESLESGELRAKEMTARWARVGPLLSRGLPGSDSRDPRDMQAVGLAFPAQ